MRTWSLPIRFLGTMARSRLFIFLLICLLFPVYGGFAQNKNLVTVSFVNTDNRKLCSFRAEIASTPEEQTKGLMFRKNLPYRSGMLFQYTTDEMRYFWMKNTSIALDIIFIGSDWEVKSVYHNARPKDESTISSRYPVQHVLEVKAGDTKHCGIGQGTLVQILPVKK